MLVVNAARDCSVYHVLVLARYTVRSDLPSPSKSPGTARPDVTVHVNDCVAVSAPSDTITVTSNRPAPDTVPVIAPVDGFTVSPAGRFVAL